FGNNQFAGPGSNFRNQRGFDRPYGRGRGGRGGWRNRGGFNNYQGQQGFGGPNQFGGQQFANPHMIPQQPSFGEEQAGQTGRGSPSYEPMKAAEGIDAGANLQHRGEDAIEGETTNAADDTNEAVANGDVQHSVEGEPDATEGTMPLDGSAEMDMSLPAGAMQGMENANVPMTDEFMYDQQGYNQSFGFGARGRGAFRGGRGGFRGGRGGFSNAYGSEATDLTPTPAPPVNAPSGPKAMREGKPNTGWYSRPQPTPSAPPVQPTPQPEQEPEKDHSMDDSRSRSRSRSRDRHRSRKHKYRDDEEGYESEESYRRRKDREKERRRRERKDKERREEKYGDDDDEMNGRSRDESRSSRYRERDDEHRSSRSHRDKERRRRHHRSRSPAKDTDANGDRRKSKSEKKYEAEYDELDRVHDRSRKHSRRDDKYANESSSHRHSRSSRDDRKYESVAKVDADDEIGFKIKGSKSASIMAPPPRRPSDRRGSGFSSEIQGAPTTGSDPYAEEREKRHAERVAKEKERQQRQSLGKRSSRDEGDDP
ncbi:hypothetical protein KC352_g36276, partial [Hortaea werneckii]